MISIYYHSGPAPDVGPGANILQQGLSEVWIDVCRACDSGAREKSAQARRRTGAFPGTTEGPGRRRVKVGRRGASPPLLSQFEGMSLSRAITSHTNCSGGSDGASSLVSAGAWRQAPHAVQPRRADVAAHYIQ
jgi:hypothetical protein